jgi:glutamate-ammonia-ligase adenylyltransferase
LKARFVAGDAALGREIEANAARAAYEQGAPDPEAMHAIRLRMERELGRERRGTASDRYDLKTGRGGLVDVEFAVQFLQMKYGMDPRVRTSDTEAALDALEAAGHVDPATASALRNGYRALRLLELRIRVVHATSVHLIEEGAPGMSQLARRMNFRAGPVRSAAAELFAHYRSVTREIRAAYLVALGIAPSDSDTDGPPSVQMTK